MSRFTRYAATSQSLSLVAMEEASRRGLREADLQDLFLALTLSDQQAGRVLRDLGITIETGRRAVEGYQEDQIASLGIRASLPPAGDITIPRTGGYQWTERARVLIGRGGDRGRTPDAAAVLRELLDEPSGVITDLLARLDTTPAMVIAGLDQASTTTARDRKARPRRRGEYSVVNESCVPAPVHDVWELLSDPERIPEWEPTIGTLEPIPDDTVEVGAARTGLTPATYPDGKPFKVHEKFRRRTLEILHITPPESDQLAPHLPGRGHQSAPHHGLRPGPDHGRNTAHHHHDLGSTPGVATPPECGAAAPAAVPHLDQGHPDQGHHQPRLPLNPVTQEHEHNRGQ